MSGITYEYMDNEGHLREMEEYSEENHVPIIQKEVGNYLKTMLAIVKPKKILELGTAIGYSAILMCDALNKDVHITTIERNDEMVSIANENIKKYGYNDNIRVIQNECEDAQVGDGCNLCRFSDGVELYQGVPHASGRLGQPRDAAFDCDVHCSWPLVGNGRWRCVRSVADDFWGIYSDAFAGSS